MTTIMGLCAFHPDSAAALLVDDAISGAMAEERLNRHKHCAGFPSLAAQALLDEAELKPEDVQHVAIARDPKANVMAKVKFAVGGVRQVLEAARRAKGVKKIAGVSELLHDAFGKPRGTLPFRMHNVEHHLAHSASAFFVSPFEEAAVLSIDGFGDFVSALTSIGRGNTLEPMHRVLFPHSMGVFYTAMTQFLGFTHYGEEWKVMGLAPYGKPTYVEQFRKLVRTTPDGFYELDMKYFVHGSSKGSTGGDDNKPHVDRLWSNEWNTLLGPERDPADDFYGKWADMAHSAQVVYEEVFFHVLNHLHKKTGMDNLCLAGGSALNSVANGKITAMTPFKNVYVQPAAGDDGTSLGAALYVKHAVLGHPRSIEMQDAYTGSAFDEDAVKAAIEAARGKYGAEFEALNVRRMDDDALCTHVATRVSEARVVGWFQGGMEFGPRALGHRSIVADPRRADMKDILNVRVKRRETYRPFAPSVLEERVGEVYERDEPSPFMLMVYKTREEWREKIPAVNHADNSGRVQSVSKTHSPRYHALISAFADITGVPLVLNTSFNENEPVVRTPAEAIDTFLRTKMQVLALGNWVLERPMDDV